MTDTEKPRTDADRSSPADQAYRERNALVAMLSRIFPAHIAYDPGAESEEWKHVVFIYLPTGQVSWHIHATDLAPFGHLGFQDNEWDGHSDGLKWYRVAALRRHHVDQDAPPLPIPQPTEVAGEVEGNHEPV